ncbi:class B sortase [Pseudobutyrivibrio sp.]|uniref:class B sortase n=1 Tax=Pseudobutyrivibrio sp. TaxID=2014367 RepID=UPI001E18BAF7|nr:class B sortase [Pseudobutyrivibrio sp.]MBE5911489.1 class B sortase [Pseudobutyrivibrio sp.]
MGKILKIIGNILIAVVILACLPLAVPKVLGYQSFNVISGSMEPEISVGSIVYVKEAAFEEIAEGDIIAFESGASVVTHRVQSVNQESRLFTTKGDANNTEDFTPVAYVNVIGKVRAHFPIIGNVATWLSESVGKIVAVIILLAGAALSAFGEKKEKKSAEDSAASTEKNAGFNPKIILILGIIIVFGSMSGFLYIYLGYQKSNTLYANLNQEFVSVADQAQIDQCPWYEMIDVDVAALQEINPDVIGWIYIEGTDISYPILYSGDDEKYLRRTMDGESATAGSIFLEGYNLPDFSDSHNIIYGHNMRNLSMFGQLKYYKSEDTYLDEHKYFQIITADKKYRYEIFSFFDTEAASWVYAVPYSDSEEFGAYIDELKSHSYKKIETTNEVDSADLITTLSTCSSSGMRFTVHGYVVDTH